jgi:hypothetical protein
VERVNGLRLVSHLKKLDGIYWVFLILEKGLLLFQLKRFAGKRKIFLAEPLITVCKANLRENRLKSPKPLNLRENSSRVGKLLISKGKGSGPFGGRDASSSSGEPSLQRTRTGIHAEAR